MFPGTNICICVLIDIDMFVQTSETPMYKYVDNNREMYKHGLVKCTNIHIYVSM